MVAKAASADAERRKYYFCNTFICGVATFSYFAMLSGQGWTAIAGCRQFFYARYVDWSHSLFLFCVSVLGPFVCSRSLLPQYKVSLPQYKLSCHFTLTYGRRVHRMITTALLILDLGLVAGQDFVTIAAVIGAARTPPPPFF